MTLKADWSHDALSIDTFAGDWTYTFTINSISSGIITGAGRAPVPYYRASLIRFGYYFIPRSDVDAFAAGVMVAPVVGSGAAAYLLPATPSTETVFYIHRFKGRVYYTAGAGTTLAEDGVTALAGGALLTTVDGNFGSPARMLAGFESPGSAITDYSVTPLGSTGGTTAGSSNGGTAAGPLLIQLNAFGAEIYPSAGEAAGLVSLPEMQVQGYEDYLSSDLNYGWAVIGPVVVEGSLYDISVRGLQEIIVGARAAETDGPMAFFELPPLQFSGYASGGSGTLPYFDIFYAGTYSSYDFLFGAFDIRETVYADADLSHRYVMPLRETLDALTGWRTFRRVDQLVAESVLGAITQQLAYGVGVAETMSGADTALAITAIQLIERVVTNDPTLHYYQAAALVAEAARAGDLAVQAHPAFLADSATATAQLAALATAYAQVLETITVADSVEMLLTVGIVEVSSAEITDRLETWGRFNAEVLERANVHLSLRFPDSGFVGWVMNTEGQRPLSQYMNFPFNSFAELGRASYAAAEGGLYRLEGPDDAGTPIEAKLKSLMFSFGTSRLKRVRSAYLGYTANGRLVLKVKAVSGGKLVEHWFEARDLEAEAPREQRVNLAMGLRSRYWQFELVNVDGADFELDEFEMHPLVLQRRV